MSAHSHSAQGEVRDPVPDLLSVRRALLSVSDKSGIVEFARLLSRHGAQIVSTGGTAAALRAAGIAVQDVSKVTGFPEILDGRVKTLHPGIHGGLLADRSLDSHRAALREHGIEGFDLVAINLYPFENTVAGGAAFAEAIEQIDIGGPAMIRAAAKNHAHVAVITDPADLADAAAALDAHGGATPMSLRRVLAARAFARTAAYDSAIASWFLREEPSAREGMRSLPLPATLRETLRYGENPHQRAALYATDETRPGVVGASLLQGKELSYNNINDADAAYELASEFASDGPAAVVIVKHANPCGVATAASLAQAWDAALACDPVSAFGGIIAANREIDADTAQRIAALFAEVVIAPGFSPRALEILSAKKNLRLLAAGSLADPRAAGRIVRSVAGGLLVQDRDNAVLDEAQLRIVTRRKPDVRELADMRFAFTVAKHVKSNAIVYARDGATVGIGAGQMSRVDSARIAREKARDIAAGGEPKTVGSVAASDAFFPFADGLEAIVEAGATAVIQPGGSMRDAEVIEAADRAGISMAMTGMRHFRH